MTINERVSNLTLDAAIDHATERADALSGPCAAQHAQLAAWLRELQQYRAAEPVAWQWFHLNQWHVTNDEERARELAWDGVKVLPLYAVPQLPQPVEPEITSEELDDELLEQLIDFRRSMLNHHRKEGNKVQTVMHGMVLRVMLELQERRAATLTAAPAVQAEHSGTTHAPEPVQSGGKVQEVQEPVSQPYTLPEYSPCVDAPNHIWLQTAGEWPASGEFSELTWSCDNQHPDDTLYVRADLVGNSPCYLQGYKDGCEWSALMAEANHPQTGDWLFNDPIELAKAIRKGPDMLPVEPGNSPAIPDGWIPVSERMPEQGRYISAVSRHGEYVSGLVEDDWLDLHDGTSFGLGEVYLWLPLPELSAAPKQEVKAAFEMGMSRYGDAMQKLADGGD